MKKITSLFFFLTLLTLNFAKITAKQAPPSANFSASQWSGCAPLTVTFYNASSGGPGSYLWNFNDPGSGIYNTSNACSPVHTFQNAGTYNVQLTFTLNGNPYVVTHTVTVHPKPNPLITGKDTVCDGTTETYTAVGAGTSTYFWTTSGGIINGSASGLTCSVTWPTPGVHTVSVTETTQFGCQNTHTYKVLVANQPRLGNFCSGRKGNGSSGDDPRDKSLPCVCQFSTRVFQALDPNGLLLSNDLFNFQWTVTGGTITGGQGTNALQVAVGAGPTITISVVVSNSFGCTDTGTCVFDVCPAPKASFKADTACLTSATHFNALASTVYAQIDSFVWDFGNGNFQSTNTGLNSWTFPSPGLYPVKLTVYYANGCSDDTTIWALVKPGEAPPISCPGTVCHNTKHCYSTPFFPGATYTWTITGGTGTPSANGDSICVLWGAGPLGNITLNVVGGPYMCGRNSVDIPIFPANINIYGSDTVCLNDFSTFSTDLIPGSCYTWSITKPGNITGPLPNTTNPGNTTGYTFTLPGTYTITLVMDNPLTCCKGTKTMQVVVQPKIQLFGPLTRCEFSTASYGTSVPVIWGPVSNGTITAQTPTTCTIQWGSATYGSIHVTAINPNLVCDNDATFPVTLVPRPPNPAINGPSVVCKGSQFIYSYDSLPAIFTNSWNVTPSAGVVYTTGPGKSRSIKFNQTGTYTITVNYTGQAPTFCTSSSTLTVTVVDTACQTITGNSQACIGQSYTYTIGSNPGNVWQWSVIGGTVTAQTPTSLTITWNNTNQGQVMISNTVCPKVCIKKVTINAIPTGTITLGKPSCKGDTIRLTGPPGYTWNWSTLATSQSIVVNTPGVYTLNIIKAGCTATLSQTVSPIPKLPKPNVNVIWGCMVAPSTPIPYQMTATYNPAWSYAWSPQTAVPAASDTLHQHYSTVSGSTHTVIVTNEHGCKDTASVTVSGPCVVSAPCQNPPCAPCSTPCNAVVNPTYDPCNGQFTANVTSGSPIAWYWDFGNGFYSNQQNPQHWFAATGTYNVSLSYFCNCTWVTVRIPVVVPYILRPKLKHTFPINCNYKTIQLAYTPTSVVTGTGISWNVDWGDGSPLYIGGSLPQNHTYNYTSDTTFIITYTVSASPPSCTKVVKDTVRLKYFDADFSFCNGCVGQAVQLVDQSSSPVPIVSWNWNFGDATTSNLQSPFHIYNNAITYNPKLVIMNQQGCKDSQTYPITITVFNAGALTFTNNGSPITPVSPGVYQICEGDQFVATAPFNSNWTYSWNNGPNTHKDTIGKSGLYWVIVGNGNGCTDTLGPFTLIVKPKPNATIMAPDTVCENEFTPMLALQGAGYSYNWSSSPAGVSGTGSTAFISGLTGPVNVYLQVTNTFGCSAWDTALVVGLAAPSGFITQNTYSPLCTGDSVQLTANITGSYTSIVWSTGQTGVTSIWVKANGLYTATVTNASGCSQVMQAFVFNFNARPDTRNVPKGCYKVCKAASPLSICGPYPVGSQVLYYQWFLNNSLYATTQNLTIADPGGNYYLEVTDSASGCKSVTPPFNVTFVNGPFANIGSPSPNPLLCKGKQACITLTVDNPSEDILYTWYIGEEPLPDTGTTIVICHPGTYILQAWMSECCKKYDTIVVKEGDCCWDSTVNYTVIQDSTVYTANQVWDGKYYVAGRLFVRNKAVLDMTTIDVVFDRDGEIIFEDSSQVRANNSVFRPCDMHDVWVGFTFKDSSSGFIHTSLFKNAQHAIDVMTSGPEGVKITDNTFTNCHIGVRLDRGARAYNHGITKNSFVIDNYDFTSRGLYTGYDYFGIVVRSTKMEEIITQNDFRNSDRSNQPNRYFGVYTIRSSVNLSENRFTNMYRSIDVTSSTGFTNIENNEIEKTWAGKYGSDVQIRATDCKEPVLIYANELRNSDNRYNGTVGIFAGNMFGLNIRDNNIKGYDVGIWTRRLNSSVINENDIDQGGDIGILDSFSRKTDINCNIVRLKDCRNALNTTCNTVGIFMQAGDNTNSIYTNCVFDTRRAIFLRSGGTGVSMPNVINNYLYNYQFAGVNVVGHLGSVGNAGQPGRNTFVSNNYAGGAREVVAVPFGSVSEGCNFGVLGNGFGVSTTACPGTTMFSSTAACGQQINNPKFYRHDRWDICESYTGKNAIIDHIGNGGIVIDKGKLTSVQAGMIRRQEFVAVAAELINRRDEVSFRAWMARGQMEKLAPAWELAILEARWEYMYGNRAAAVAALQSLATSDTAAEEQRLLLLAEWSRLSGQAPAAGLYARLAAMDAAGGDNSAAARDALHAANGGLDYRFGGWYVEPADRRGAAANMETSVKVVPNPATSSALVQFTLPGNQVEVTLYDITGNLIAIEALKLGDGAYTFDLKGLAAGIYMVSVYDLDNKERHVTKLIKQ